MTRHWLAHFRARVLIPVMFAAVSYEHAAHSGKLLNEFDTLHDT